MKKFLISLFLMCAFQAQAAVVTVNVSDAIVEVGDTFTVTVEASLDDTLEFFDTLDMDVTFDNTLFGFVANSFGSDLPDDGFDNLLASGENMFGLGVSFVSFVQVFTGDLVLASFELEALAVGQSVIDVFFYSFEDFAFQQTVSAQVNPATVTITDAQPVNTPAMFGLLLLAGAMTWIRRKA